MDALPIDVWVPIFAHIEPSTRVRQFDLLVRANIFPAQTRLDTFWSIMGQLDRTNEVAFDEMPSADLYKVCASHLSDMGLPADVVSRVVQDARGDLYAAMRMLGWN